MRSPKKTPSEITKKESGLVTQVRRYKLITPLFGGGVTPGEADPITVVRATEVRGHLRFWWRAARGGQSGGDPTKMKAAEEEIWGSAAQEGKPGPSQVSVVVTPDERHRGEADHPFEVIPQRNNPARPSIRARRESNVPPYAAFPLQPTQDEAQIGMVTRSVLENVQFSLELTYPKAVAAEVEAALWAWETFGGLGARTRRGFGALHCIEAEQIVDREKTPSAPLILERGELIRQTFQGVVNHVSEGTWPPDVPHLTRNIEDYQIAFNGEPTAVWGKLVNTLKDFRQNRRPGQERNRPGRSYWPEPEAIRRLTGQRKPIHQPLDPEIDAFPRARFGLPIIFHFKDAGRNPNDLNSDPSDATLQGKGKIDRMASPLILRPLAYGNGQALGLAAILSTPETPPGGLSLYVGRAEYDANVDVSGRASEIKPLREQNNNPNVLRAFLSYLKSQES